MTRTDQSSFNTIYNTFDNLAAYSITQPFSSAVANHLPPVNKSALLLTEGLTLYIECSRATFTTIFSFHFLLSNDQILIAIVHAQYTSIVATTGHNNTLVRNYDIA